MEKAAKGHGPNSGLADLHVLDESVVNGIDMLNHLVYEYAVRGIADNLLNTDYNPALAVIFETYRFDVRIHDAPLSDPIISDFLSTVKTSAFHSVRPIYIGMHQGEYPIDVARVECRVGSGKNLMIRFHVPPDAIAVSNDDILRVKSM